ncbi:MAG: choice-of-anchor tandem repeat GloVer-containing protein [Candidatus Cybelea sp.]
MRILGFSRCALTSCAAAAMLAACGGSQPPVGAQGALLQSRSNDSYTSLYSFGKGSDGQQPKAALIDVNSALYGTTYGGGAYGDGTVFSVSTTGTEKVLYSFLGGNGSANDGANPSASLLAVKGALYGTTEYGGIASYGGCNAGTIFRISTLGVEKVVYRFYGFNCHGYFDGANPVASLVVVKGRLYGTTLNGGINEHGTVFRVSTSGSEKVLHSFELYEDGANPVASLIDVKGTLYGTTEEGIGVGGSSSGFGTVFAVNTAGAENVRYNFQGSDGADPAAGLININGTLYGTTAGGGAYGTAYGTYGTAFSLTTGGSFTNLHSFGSGADGSRPVARLLYVRGKLYGTTPLGGAYGKGTVFRMSLTGSNEKVLHSFGHGTDGAAPLAGLINVTGTLYGTTSAGGTYGDGTVFALKLGSK